jgi:tetratricopeptide (TPR) repeat protein/tRNA A-37 threonylcarbamoyl transferase component Bud32
MSTPSLPPSEETIFAHACALPPAERAAYLDRACGGDAQLRANVDALLRAEADVGFMAAPAADRTPVPAPLPAEKPGDRIGRYKLLQKIGEGGCGIVYLAEQQEPVVRRVAVKVIKLGMDTREVIARFEAERQALALMDHPNIARVFDAGATETGRPFFVMELVRGVPITKYCDEQNLSTVARLELFTSVCHAVQHAHQKGIIHRDLKPSNILVTVNDGRPVPKVIDFGIAKATQGRLTDATVFTAFEQFIGTPAYMSPEQAVMTSLDVDTRSDIYSLGVLLYELLTGRTPFDSRTLITAGLDEIRRVIREVDPPRPSTSLATLADAARATVAKQRGIPPGQLSSLLRGDLDWIVMRCLEKDRARRYETAASLAQDLARHLKSEPVLARPASAAYRLQKTIRRHRLLFAGGATVALAVFAGAGAATWQAVRATRAEKAAKAEAAKSSQVAGFLKSIFGEIGPSVLKGRDTALLTAMLDQAAKRVPIALRDQPEVQGELYYTLGWGFYSVSEYARAESAFRAAVEIARKRSDPGALANLLNQLAIAVLDGGDPVRAEPLLQEALTLLPPSQRETQAIRHDVLRVLASAQQKRGHYREAAVTGRALLASQRQMLGPQHEDVARTLHIFAPYESQAGNLPLAEAMLREALDLRRRHAGAPSYRVVETQIAVGECLIEQGEFREAEPMLNEAATALRAQRNPSPARFWGSLGSLASAWSQRGNLTLADALLREQLAYAQQEFSPNNTFVGWSHLSLAQLLRKKGDRDAAEAECRRALAIFEQVFGRKGRHFPATLELHARLLLERSRHDEAEAVCRDALAARRATAGEDNGYILPSLEVLALVQAARGDLARAIATNREHLAIAREHLGARHPQTATSLVALAENLARHGGFQEAEANVSAAWSIEQALGYHRRERQRDLRRAHEQLYAAWAKVDPAKAPLAAEWREKLREFERVAQP